MARRGECLIFLPLTPSSTLGSSLAEAAHPRKPQSYRRFRRFSDKILQVASLGLHLKKELAWFSGDNL